ncbi:MAG: tRNA (guanosine(37)-N1)-methyltransferase TrmD [Coriobacteriia bacterium]|jgi:tRNA (guanine37-N1)-methyltransferase|nr:tRNA (guanosine(37)-N1)-methyltransferase TrmD [Coriobacteriia bacterium]MDR2713948.1 tRNA (guanosine(37)-N1)-methyltransferase TrmD [Coriobacteriales bacterium]
MRIEVLSIFPQMFNDPMGMSIIGRAREAGILDFEAHDLRTWTHDKHRTTDDEPYGGGQGQLMKVEPVFEALDELLQTEPATVIFFAPFGEPFTQQVASELSEQERLVLVCGRYEGLDERVYTQADRIISMGDYIVTGGELPAMMLTDAVCRLLPGALGDELSNVDESFTQGLLEYPQYTRPASYRDLDVPDVLLSGDHAKIAAWRRKMSIIRTAQLRPDLLAAAELSKEEQALVILAQAEKQKSNAEKQENSTKKHYNC